MARRPDVDWFIEGAEGEQLQIFTRVPAHPLGVITEKQLAESSGCLGVSAQRLLRDAQTEVGCGGCQVAALREGIGSCR